MPLSITKIDGTRESFDADKINQSIAAASVGLKDQAAKIMQIASETQLTLYDGITTTELDQAVIGATVQNIKDDPDFDIIASRLLLKLIYKSLISFRLSYFFYFLYFSHLFIISFLYSVIILM